MKKILFVDDDPNMLEGLKRKLHKMEDWETTFAASGKEALDLLASRQFDVIVSDYKMPMMDGLALFKQVKERHPSVMRILFTGQSEAEIFEESKELVHLYLSKPFNIEALIKAIN